MLVNNAGITRDKPLHKMEPDHWRAVISTNLDSLFNMTRNVWEGMRSRGYGRVINISSVNGQKGQFGQVNYSSAKAGVIGFTKAVAQEGAAKGITCNCVCPGYIGTEMVRAVPEEVLKSKILPQVPIGRLGEPEEIGRCVVFLAGEDAGFFTGSTPVAERRSIHGLIEPDCSIPGHAGWVVQKCSGSFVRLLMTDAKGVQGRREPGPPKQPLEGGAQGSDRLKFFVLAVASSP